MARYFGIAGAIETRGCEGENGELDFALCPTCQFKPDKLPSCFFSIREQTLLPLVTGLPDEMQRQLLRESEIPLTTLKRLIELLPDGSSLLEKERPTLITLIDLTQKAIAVARGLESDE